MRVRLRVAGYFFMLLTRSNMYTEYYSTRRLREDKLYCTSILLIINTAKRKSHAQFILSLYAERCLHVKCKPWFIWYLHNANEKKIKRLLRELKRFSCFYFFLFFLLVINLHADVFILLFCCSEFFENVIWLWIKAFAYNSCAHFREMLI
jgi:hypothetical protein